MIKSNSKWLSLIKDVNFNYAPSQISFKADVFRQFGSTRPRNVGGGPYKIPETYNKFFTFDRYYIVQWRLTNSINLDFSATNNARIDEPFGRIDTKDKKIRFGRDCLKEEEILTTSRKQRLLIMCLPIKFLCWTGHH